MNNSIIKAHNLLCESEGEQLELDLGDSQNAKLDKSKIKVYNTINFEMIKDWIKSIPETSHDEGEEYDEFTQDSDNSLENLLGKAIGNPNNYRGSADWGGATVWSLSEAPNSGVDGYAGEYLAFFDDTVVFGERDGEEDSDDVVFDELSFDDLFDKKALNRFFDEVKEKLSEHEGKDLFESKSDIKVGDFVSKKVKSSEGVTEGTEGYVISISSTGKLKLTDEYGNVSKKTYDPSGFKVNAKKTKAIPSEISEILSEGWGRHHNSQTNNTSDDRYKGNNPKYDEGEGYESPKAYERRLRQNREDDANKAKSEMNKDGDADATGLASQFEDKIKSSLVNIGDVSELNDNKLASKIESYLKGQGSSWGKWFTKIQTTKNTKDSISILLNTFAKRNVRV